MAMPIESMRTERMSNASYSRDSEKSPETPTCEEGAA